MVAVGDDGRGLDLERLRVKYSELHGQEKAETASVEEVAEIIFQSGMSTAQELTDISGRGVGMDAVRSFVHAEGGSVTLALNTDEGNAAACAFELKLKIPLSGSLSA